MASRGRSTTDTGHTATKGGRGATRTRAPSAGQRQTFEAAEGLLEVSGVLDIIDKYESERRSDHRGAKATVSARTVLLGMIMAAMDQRPHHLRWAYTTLQETADYWFETGFMRAARPDERKRLRQHYVPITKSSFYRAHMRLVEALGEPEARTKLKADGSGSSTRYVLPGPLADVIHQLFGASNADTELDETAAIDSTGIRAAVNHSVKPQPANAHAGWYVKEKEKTVYLFGYSLTALVGKDAQGSTRVLGLELTSGNAHDLTTALDYFARRPISGIKRVIADKAYTRGNELSSALLRQDIHLVGDQAEHQRGHRATDRGVAIVNGTPCCPAIPDALKDIGPAPSMANDVDPQTFGENYQQQANFHLLRHGGVSRF